jgi:hypothetical protein
MTADVLLFKPKAGEPRIVTATAREPALACHCLSTNFELGLTSMTLRCARCGCKLPVRVAWVEEES